MPAPTYIIRGGIAGRERLRILSRVMRPTSLDLLRRAGLNAGMNVLEIGCGGGDLAFDIARVVGAAGRVLGTDIDQTKLDLAKGEASEQGLANMNFQLADITESAPAGDFDLVHARFVLTHLTDPARALTHIQTALRPGGIIVLEDIDFRGYFCYPECAAIWRYVQLYTETTKRKGVDANIGPRLPGLLAAAGFENVRMNVVQPAGAEGEVKLMSPLTMENIADAVIAENLATSEEIDRIVAELYTFARTPGTVGCMPRIFEAWATRPAGSA
jgi:SAM-dependent methyltransferase